MGKNDEPHAGHRDRMWGKFGGFGIDVFDEHEILEILLFLLIPRVNTNVIAHELINEFGSLKNVLFAPREDLLRVDGIGKGSAMKLNFIGALVDYTNQKQIEGTIIFSSTKITVEYCINHFNNKTSECMTLILLDDKNALLHVHDITNNLPNHVFADFYDIFAEIIKYRCRKVIIAHNHTTGTTDPSDDDLRLTRELGNVLKIIKVGLIDHVIVHNGTAASLRDLGVLGDVWVL